ncbi:MAG: hypothetical protein PF447_06995, partial [Spirochaetaceae bacterium]|jgi:nitrogen fixation protein NifB|nr:hypothetical protein [Spirochaetaceae bacterium]
LALLLKDCSTVLVSGIGPKPEEVLKKSGLAVHQLEGLISTAEDRVYQEKSLDSLKAKNSFACGTGCQGNAQGCG